jgi:hypothetical protein
MSIRREEQLIFRGCVPVDAAGEVLPMLIDGEPRTGREMFESIDRVVYRVMDGRSARDDLDLLWYLWSGPLIAVVWQGPHRHAGARSDRGQGGPRGDQQFNDDWSWIILAGGVVSFSLLR